MQSPAPIPKSAEPSQPHPERAVRQAVAMAGVLALAVLLFSFLVRPDGLTAYRVCLLHRLTGLPCPCCGLTRAFCAIGHGDWAAAWHLNPFAFPLYAAVIAALFWAVWKWCHPRQTLLPPRSRRFVRGLVLLTAAGMVLYDVWRILHGWR